MFSKKFLIGQRIGLGFAVSLFVLLVIGLFSLRNLIKMQDESAWVTHTVEVMAALRQFESAYSGVESAGRGYMLSGDPNFKAETEHQRVLTTNTLGRLRALTSDNANQQPRLARLQDLMTIRFALSQRLIEIRDQGITAGDRRAAEIVRQGQDTSEQFRSILQEIGAEESGLLEQRQVASRHATALTRNTVVFGSLAALTIILVAGIVLARSITGPLADLRASATRIGEGDYAHRAAVDREDEVGHLARVFNEMSEQVQQRQLALANQDWLKSGLARFAALSQQQRDSAASARPCSPNSPP
ncbi:MAG: CHASE3 domain-containing protein [Lacunisphaera sp.]